MYLSVCVCVCVCVCVRCVLCGHYGARRYKAAHFGTLDNNIPVLLISIGPIPSPRSWFPIQRITAISVCVCV